MTPSWIATLIALIRPVLPADFVGRIEVNVFKGGVSNVNVSQSYKGDHVTGLGEAGLGKAGPG